MEKVKLATEIAKSFLGKPYIWGGDDPIKGFDCSGFVIEILKSVGKLPYRGDWTASMLYDIFRDRTSLPEEGCLCFLYSSGRPYIYHVMYLISSEFVIGASGGGSSTLTTEDAIKKNAYIKIRPLMRYSNKLVVNPFKERR
jgi:cell wall-associated NlpC family hydrolase